MKFFTHNHNSILLVSISICLPLQFFAIGGCEAEKFFFTFFHDKGSHFGSMRPLMERLAEKGHTVTFLDTIHGHDVSPSLHAIHATLPTAHDDEATRKAMAHILWHKRLTATDLAKFYKQMDELFGVLLANHTEQIVNVTNEQWDVIVIDELFWSFGFALTTLQHRMWQLQGKQQAAQPLIVQYSIAAQSLMSMESVRSVGRNWVSRVPMCPYLPTDSDDVYSPSKFLHRLHAFAEVLAEFLMLNIYVTPFLMPNIEEFGVPHFSWYELYARIAIVLTDTVDRVGLPQSIGSDFVNVGAHCKRPKRLNKKFANFVEDPESNGTIFAAFGTHVDWSNAPEAVINAMFGAFNRLTTFRIIFVYNGPMPSGALGPHVMLTKWAPQVEILAHFHTKAFITHGGSKSVREALCAGVPIIVMPMYAEQAHSAHLFLAMQISPVINKFTLTEDTVYHTITEVVHNPESSRKARKLQQMFLDRPMPALDEGIFGIERLMRGKKAMVIDAWRQFTQRKGMHLGWTQFAYVDGMGLLLLAISVILL